MRSSHTWLCVATTLGCILSGCVLGGWVLGGWVASFDPPEVQEGDDWPHVAGFAALGAVITGALIGGVLGGLAAVLPLLALRRADRPNRHRRRTPGLEVRREELDSSVASRLIATLNAELTRTYPEEGATHFRLDPEETREGRGAFLVAYHEGAPVGCGAIRRIDDATAELKRMYVASSERGRGFGRRILHELIAEARRLAVRRVVLETGTRQEAALVLYESEGFVRIPPFGEYVGSPLSICMERTL